MINQSKIDDPRFWDKWRKSGALSRYIGKAYAFFDCDVSKEELQDALPDARERVQTPKNLEVVLHE